LQARPQPRGNASEFRRNRGHLEAVGARPSDNHDIGTLREMGTKRQAEIFSDPAFDPIAYNRIADSARNRSTKPDCWLIWQMRDVEDEMRRLKAHAPTLGLQKFRPPMEPVGGTKGEPNHRHRVTR
jgi:hypothetical protein